jgi:hypothetical protein
MSFLAGVARPIERIARPKMTIKSLTVHLDETTDARLGVLSQRCDTTPERFVEMLCQSLDGETLERIVLRAMVDDTTPEPGIAKMPERRAAAPASSGPGTAPPRSERQNG